MALPMTHVMIVVGNAMSQAAPAGAASLNGRVVALGE